MAPDDPREPLRSPEQVCTHVVAAQLDTTYRPQRSDRANLVQVSGAILTRPGQNGHLELRVGRGDPPEVLVGVLAMRQELGAPAAGRCGVGGQLTAIVPPGHSYRLVTNTIRGFQTPEFVLTTMVTETTL